MKMTSFQSRVSRSSVIGSVSIEDLQYQTWSYLLEIYRVTIPDIPDCLIFLTRGPFVLLVADVSVMIISCVVASVANTLSRF
jgi:hypothetical protein